MQDDKTITKKEAVLTEISTSSSVVDSSESLSGSDGQDDSQVNVGTHQFNGEDIEADIRANPFQLSSKTIPSAQYNDFSYAHPDLDGFDGFDKVWNTLSPEIGTCIIVYSELEDALETHLHELISDRSDQLGMMATRQMTYIQKVNLYIDLLRVHVSAEENYLSDVDMLKKHLVRAAETRNIIAHARWPSVTREGYVFSSLEAINAERGMPDLRYFKLNKGALESSFSYISAVVNMPYYIQERYF